MRSGTGTAVMPPNPGLDAFEAECEALAADLDAAVEHAGLSRVLRGAAERIGAYVLLLGDVGSHRSDIGEDVFRGFALADDVAPFVVVNDNDAVAARAFIHPDA